MADNQFIARKGLISLDDSQITGSLSITNAVTASVFTGSFRGDGANLYNIPSSGVTGLNLDKIISGSVSASISPNNGFRINTDVYIDGTVTAKEIHIDYVTSSVLYQSGSTKFGDTLDDLHEFTGSVTITGSITLNGQAIGTGKLDETTFESFTSSYNTGSFTGSFGGQFTGAASENLKYVGIWSGTTYGYYLVNDVVKYNNSLYVCNNNVFGNGTPDLDGSFTLLSDITPTGSFLITSSFESFTGSYTTGSFTGSFTGSIQGTATTASYVNLTNIDGFTDYSSSVSSSINSVLDATTPITATINNTNSPFTITNQTIVIVDSTNGNVTINLPDLDTVVGTPNQRPIIIYKNDYSQNVVFVEPSGSQLVNGTTRDIIASIQIGIVYNPTSAGWVTEGTSYQSLAELELFFVPRTETGSLSVSTASYVEYTNVANKPSLVSGSSQISFNGITDKPTLVSGSSQITYSGLTGVPSGIVSGSSQITYSGLTGTPSGIVSGSSQVLNYGIFATTGSNAFIGTQTITGSLYISSDLVVQGSSSLQNITASAVNIGANIVNLNTANPVIRFAGLNIFDSGSIGGSGSFLYDAVQDEFIFVHRGDNANITSSVVLMGPQTYNNVGSETYPTANRILKGIGNEHVGDSIISETGGGIGISGSLSVSGSLTVNGTSAVIGSGSTNYVPKFTGASIIGNSVVYDNGNQIGIGQTTLFTKFSIADSLAATSVGSNYNPGILNIQNTNTTNGNISLIGFQDASAFINLAAIGSINEVHSSSPNNVKGSLGFYTKNNGTSYITEKMRLDASGNLGIGTITPASRLNVAGAKTNSSDLSNAANQLAVTDTTATAAGVGGRISFLGSYTATPDYITLGAVEVLKDNANNYGSSGWNNAAMRFIVGNNDNDANAGRMLERMRIASDGTKYFGNPSGSRFQMNGSGENLYQYTNNYYIWGLYNDANSLSIESAFGGNIIFRTANQTTSSSPTTTTERMRIDSGGTVQVRSGNELRVYRSDNARYGTFYNDNSNVHIAASVDPIRISSIERTEFYVTGVERMRTTSGGRTLLIGSSSSGWSDTNRALLELNHTGSALLGLRINGDQRAYFYHNNSHLYIENMLAGGSIYVISNSGGVYLTSGGTSWTSNSDERLKNINGEIENAVNKLMTLRTVNYSWKNDETEKENLGLIAQDVEKVFPELIDKNKLPSKPNEEQEDETEYLGVRYQELIPVLVKAIQEQQEQIEILKAEIQTLKQ
jgi:hypothetical protein